jgi:hypothetical protein
VGDNQINDDKNAGTLLAILMAMTMQQYGTMCITQWSISRATLEAPTTGKCLCPITLTATMVIEIWGKHKKNNKTQLLSNYKPIGAAPQGHFFVGGGGGVWAKKFVTLRGLQISEKKEILRKPTVDIVS